MKIKHKCGHTQEWNPPNFIPRDYSKEMPGYIEYLKRMICVTCEQKRIGATIN